MLVQPFAVICDDDHQIVVDAVRGGVGKEGGQSRIEGEDLGVVGEVTGTIFIVGECAAGAFAEQAVPLLRDRRVEGFGLLGVIDVRQMGIVEVDPEKNTGVVGLAGEPAQRDVERARGGPVTVENGFRVHRFAKCGEPLRDVGRAEVTVGAGEGGGDVAGIRESRAT